jgi:putative glutamine amidotransferase
MQMVNSLHHQGVERVAETLKATAYAPDGLVEALEVPDHPFGLAVQWHPEWLQEHEAMRLLFGALVDAAGRRK